MIEGEATCNSSLTFTATNIPSEPKMAFWYDKATPGRKAVFINYGGISSRLTGLFFQTDYDAGVNFYNDASYLKFDTASKSVTFKSPSGYVANRKVGYAIVV